MIVLVQKPYQEYVTNIEDFIWHICVSCCRFNGIIESFQFLKPRCEDVFLVLSCGAGNIWIIS